MRCSALMVLFSLAGPVTFGAIIARFYLNRNEIKDEFFYF
jgi:hypothetical protein